MQNEAVIDLETSGNFNPLTNKVNLAWRTPKVLSIEERMADKILLMIDHKTN